MQPQMTMMNEEPEEMQQDEGQEPREEGCESCRHWEAKAQEYGICHLISGGKEPPLTTAKGMLITPPGFYCSSYEPLEEEAPQPSPEEVEAILMGLKGQ